MNDKFSPVQLLVLIDTGKNEKEKWGYKTNFPTVLLQRG